MRENDVSFSAGVVSGANSGHQSGSNEHHVMPSLSRRFASVPHPERAARLMHLALWFFIGGIVLALVLINPTPWISFSFLKLSAFSICLTVAGILYLLSRRAAPAAWDESVDVATRRAVAYIALIPLVYLVSYYFSVNRTLALVGVGGETDTLLFVFLGFATLFFGYEIVHSIHAAKKFLNFVIGASVAAVVFQYLNIFWGASILPVAVFGDQTTNLIGRWNELGLVAALTTLLLVLRAEFTDVGIKTRRFLIAGIVVLLLQLIIINFYLAWALLLIGAVIVALYKHRIIRAQSGSESAAEMVPEYWYAGAVAIVAAVFFLWGSAVLSRAPAAFSVPSLEVRPAATATYEIAWSAHGGSFSRDIIGSGPNTFAQEWIMHKPSAVNQTQFWNVNFSSGFSTLLTAFVSIGLLGAIAWLIPLALVFLGLWKLRKLVSGLSSAERFAILGLGLSSAFLWTSSVFYAMSQDTLLLAFAATGAFIGMLGSVRARLASASELSPMMRRTKIIAAIALLIIAALIAGLAVRRLLSSGYAQRAAVVLNQGDVTTAITLAARSQSIELTEENLLLGVAVDLTQMQNLLNATTTPQDQMAAVRTQFQNLLSESLAQAQAASAQNPQDYQPYLALANIYELVLPLKITGAYENARQVYAKAMDLNPTNPTLPLLLARLEANQDLKGNLADITRLIEQAETLKNNYTDAYLFAEQVAVSMNDLPGATAAARAALQSAPDQAPLWFELGLLYYSGANYTDAVAALEQAVSMTPQYANAKYFLGLAYYKENRLAEATRQFEDLVQTNSDNAEVKLILENLKAGKDPFAGAQPPITSNPAQRQQAPIKE